MSQFCKDACRNYRINGPKRSKPYCNARHGRPGLMPDTTTEGCTACDPGQPEQPATPEKAN